MKTKTTPIWWQAFICEYLKNGLNAKQAYLKVKPNVTDHVAEVESSKLLRKPEFSCVLEELRSELKLNLADEIEAFVEETIRRGQQYRRDIDAAKAQMAPAIDPTALDALSRAEVRITDMVRKAFGLPDSPGKVEPTGGVILQVIDPYAKQEP
jgi:hypothetical protein